MSLSLPRPYEYVGSIGQGAFGRVVKARNVDTNIEVACKIVSYEGVKDPESMFKESRILKHMHHPYIVQCYDVIDDKENCTLYVFMELCESDLQRLIDDSKSKKRMVPEAAIWGFLAQAIQALTYLHSPFNKKYQDEEGVTHNIGKVYHRDIKPANLLLDADGNIKLADFNVSTAIKGDKLNSTKCGTPLYAPPEIHEGVREYHGGAVDIWSLGCTIYHVCALRPPFVAVGMGPLIRMIRSGVYPEMPKFYSKELHEVIENMIRPKPACRISTADLLQHSRIVEALESMTKKTVTPELQSQTISSNGTLAIIGPSLPLSRADTTGSNGGHTAPKRSSTSSTVSSGKDIRDTTKHHSSDLYIASGELYREESHGIASVSSAATGSTNSIEAIGISAPSVNSGHFDHSNSGNSTGTMGISGSSDPPPTLAHKSQEHIANEDSSGHSSQARPRFDPLGSKINEVPRVKPMPTSVLPKTAKPRIFSNSTRNPTPSRSKYPVRHSTHVDDKPSAPTPPVVVENCEKQPISNPLEEQREKVLAQSKSVHRLLLSAGNKNSAINMRTGQATSVTDQSTVPQPDTAPVNVSTENEINQMVTKALQNRRVSSLYEVAGIITNSVGTPERVYSAVTGRSFTPTQRTPSVVQLPGVFPLRSNTASVVHMNDESLSNDSAGSLIDVEGNTRLIRACKRSSYTDAVSNLTQAGAQNKKGETALLWAAFFNNSDLCRLLMDKEAKLTTKDGTTALMKAAGHGSLSTVELLLNYEGRMHNNDGLTALMFATMNHHTKCVELLAPVEATLSRHDGSTSLIMAATRGYDDIVKILSAHESKIQNKDGKTALMEASLQGKLACAKILCQCEARMINKDGKTALIFAASKGNSTLVQLLAPYEASMSDARNYTGLMYAAMNGHPEVCKILLGAEHGSCDKDGRTALMIAATYNRAECCEVLAPVEGNRKGSFFSSALKIAARKGHIESLRKILPYEGETYGLEALDVALREGHKEIVEELQIFLNQRTAKRDVANRIASIYKYGI